MDIEELNRICKNTLMELLDIRFTGFDGKSILAEMQVTPSKYQPSGLLHGGALLSLAESAASAGSFLLVDNRKFDVLGTEINSQHLSSIKEGRVLAKADIIHQGKHKHIWDVSMSDHNGRLLSVARVTNRIMERKTEGREKQE